MRLIWIAALVLLLGGTVAQAVVRSPPLRSAEVDVSNLPGPQTNATIAVDPTNPNVLLAGSNDVLHGTQEIYSSTDGGAKWASAITTRPPDDIAAACPSDPGVAIDLTGRQYYSYDVATPCSSQGSSRIYLLTRSGPTASWSKPILVARLGSARFDDKPGIAVDVSPASPHRNRVYVAWTRVARNTSSRIVLSHSDDGGATWSAPVALSPNDGHDVTYASVATARNGVVYVAWTDETTYSVRLVRSTNGGRTFGPQRVAAAFTIVPIPYCGIGIVVPAEPRSCIQADPTVLVDTSGGRYSGRVYLTYTGTNFTGDEGASLSTFDSALRPVAGYPATHQHRLIAPQARRADEFWVQSALDSSDGALWICFYDTNGDPTLKKVRYSCTVSRNGGQSWSRTVRAASVFSNETQKGATFEYGFYQGVAASQGIAHPIWTDTRRLATLNEEIYTARLSERAMPAGSGS
jgi:hypothetical protein